MITQDLIVKNTRTNTTTYGDFFQKTNALLDSNDWSISYVYDKTAADILALQNKGSSDAASLITLTRLHIKNGDYVKSLKSAQQAVQAAPKKAEAHYVLGLAQDYTQLLPESDASFKKAEALGYQLWGK